MRRAALVLSFLLLSVPLTATAYSPYTERAFEAWDRLIVPLPDGEDDAVDCRTFDGCPEDLEGVSYQDHRVGPYIEDAEQTPLYYLYSYRSTTLVNYNDVVVWELCGFDADENLLGCHEHEGEWLNAGFLDEETEHLRLILRQGFYNPASISIWT